MLSDTAIAAASKETVTLSVVMPTYNAERWLVEALDSVLLAQGDIDLELVIVDDGSVDATWALVEERAASDGRVRAMRSPGVGSSAARNAGVEASRGKYLAFVDSDDVVPPGAFRILIASLEASGSDLALGACETFVDVPSDGSLYYPRLEKKTYGSIDEVPGLLDRVTLWDAIYRRDAWVRFGIEARPAIRGNDLVPKAKVLLLAEGIDTVGETIYYYRVGSGANIMSRRATTSAGVKSFLIEHLERARMISTLGTTKIRESAATTYMFSHGIGHMYPLLAARGPMDEDARELRLLAEAVLRAYGVNLVRVAASKRGMRNIGRVLFWGMLVHCTWPVSCALARTRTLAKQLVYATRSSRVAQVSNRRERACSSGDELRPGATAWPRSHVRNG